ncbi:MAG: hypothetical protein P4L33_05515 [Capsulimonadaceae bacterium]|nr:hypothetical protein [Capsulimonadaceae bacterium]
MPDGRINITLTDEARATLEQYASRSGVDVGTYIKNSLQVMNALQDEKRDKHRVYIGTSNKVIKELDVP